MTNVLICLAVVAGGLGVPWLLGHSNTNARNVIRDTEREIQTAQDPR